MVKKSPRHKKRERTKEQKKSSWGAVLVSFLKEFFLNFAGPGHLYYDENLTDAGKKRKKLLWGTIMLVIALVSALLPLEAWNMIVPDVLAGKIFIAAICECFAVFIGSRGIIMLKEALKKE